MLKSLAEFFFLRKLAIAGIIISCRYELPLIKQHVVYCYGFLYRQRHYKIILVQFRFFYVCDMCRCV